MLIGYARVSTQEQDTQAQISALKSAGCELIFQEKASGGRWDRPELQGVSLDIENYCTLRLFFDLSTLAGLSRRNLPEAGIRLLFQI